MRKRKALAYNSKLFIINGGIMLMLGPVINNYIGLQAWPKSRNYCKYNVVSCKQDAVVMITVLSTTVRVNMSLHLLFAGIVITASVATVGKSKVSRGC